MCNVEGAPLRQRKPQPLRLTDPLPIYLDYNATTPLGSEAWQAMLSVRDVWGNPSSSHPYGFAAKHALESARRTLADALHVPSSPRNGVGHRVVFTSGGTEANNLAIVGGLRTVRAAHPHRCCIVTSNVEHPAVAEVVERLCGGTPVYAPATPSATRPTLRGVHKSEAACADMPETPWVGENDDKDEKNVAGKNEAAPCRDAPTTAYVVPVDAHSGVVDVATLRATLLAVPGGPQCVAMVSVIFANNELGSVNDIAALVRTTKELCGAGCLFHSDAAQALGKVAETDVSRLGVDLLSLAAHKFYGPKGVGALYISSGVCIDKVTFGANHEDNLRPGTESVLLASGLAAAAADVCAHGQQYMSSMRATRNELARVLRCELHTHDMDFIVNGSLDTALCNTLNCAIYKKLPDRRKGLPCTYISGPRLIQAVGDLVCISAGSACHSVGKDEEVVVSAALQAVGVSLPRAVGTLRISTGRYTTIGEARRAARIIARHAAQQFAEY